MVVGMKLLVINGPNLNFLGIREKSVYGTQDYDYLLKMIAEKGRKEGCTLEVFQSNHEGAIIDRIQDAYFDGRCTMTTALKTDPVQEIRTEAVPKAEIKAAEEES